MIFMNDRILIGTFGNGSLIAESLPAHHTTIAAPIASADDLDRLLSREDFDLIVLHVAIPNSAQENLIADLRKKTKRPIIVLGVTGHEEAIRSLNAGADDYVPFPASRAELDARASALIRRSRMSERLSLLGLTLDRDNNAVLVDGKQLHLTQKEQEILEVLLRRKGQPTSPKMLLAHLYPEGQPPTAKIINVFIHKLRNKLSSTGSTSCPTIETVWGRGYYLTASPEQ